MRVIRTVALAVSLVICSLLAFSPARAQVDIAISVDVEPPLLPVYDQPPIPEPGYFGYPAIGRGTTAPGIIGYAARPERSSLQGERHARRFPPPGVSGAQEARGMRNCRLGVRFARGAWHEELPFRYARPKPPPSLQQRAA